MRFERLSDTSNEMYGKAMDLYSISFPPHEQRRAMSQTDILSNDEYHFNLIYDEAIFVGIILCWETADFIYVEHFCTFPELRNNCYGAKTLELLKKSGKTVILEIDPPVDEISQHRKGFYERSGFVENPYPHVHPPYHKGNNGHALVIMSAPKQLAEDEYNLFKQYLDATVMANVYY